MTLYLAIFVTRKHYRWIFLLSKICNLLHYLSELSVIFQ